MKVIQIMLISSFIHIISMSSVLKVGVGQCCVCKCQQLKSTAGQD
jgi:hypothetical protein